MICSTAAKTEMSLGVMKREFLSMQDRCRATIIRSLTNEGQIEQLLLPRSLKVNNVLVHRLRHLEYFYIFYFGMLLFISNFSSLAVHRGRTFRKRKCCRRFGAQPK